MIEIEFKPAGPPLDSGLAELYQAMQQIEVQADLLELTQFVQTALPPVCQAKWLALLLDNGKGTLLQLPLPETRLPNRRLMLLNRAAGIEISTCGPLASCFMQFSQPCSPAALPDFSESQLLQKKGVQLVVPLVVAGQLLGLLLAGGLSNPGVASGRLGIFGLQLGNFVQNQKLACNERNNLVKHNVQLIMAREEERKCISRELHDDVVQDLFLSLSHLETLRGQDLPESLLQDLAWVYDRTEQSLNAARRICNNLRPRLLDVSLSFSLNELVRRSRQTYPQLELGFEIEGNELASSEVVRLTIYRVAQEALNNIHKHAKASRARLTLKFKAEKEPLIELTVQDNGKGFSPPANFHELLKQDHLGLLGMYERVKTENGFLRLVSVLNKGTTIVVRLPATFSSSSSEMATQPNSF